VEAPSGCVLGWPVVEVAAAAAFVAGAVVVVEDGTAPGVVAGLTVLKRPEGAAAVVVDEAVVLVAAVADGVPSLNRPVVVLGAVEAVVLGAAVVVDTTGKDGKRDGVGAGADVGCVVLPSPPKGFAVPALDAIVVEVAA
jgi:hypothetical protein